MPAVVQPSIADNMATNKLVAMLNRVISNELQQRIGKLAPILNKTSAESKQHRNDQIRADYIQSDKHAKIMAEAYAQFQPYKHDNATLANNDVCQASFS